MSARLGLRVRLARTAAGEVGRLAGVAVEGRVHNGGGVAAGGMAPGDGGRPIGALRVEVGELSDHEAWAEPAAQLFDHGVGRLVEVGARGLGRAGEGSFPLTPLEERVLERVR